MQRVSVLTAIQLACLLGGLEIRILKGEVMLPFNPNNLNPISLLSRFKQESFQSNQNPTNLQFVALLKLG